MAVCSQDWQERPLLLNKAMALFGKSDRETTGRAMRVRRRWRQWRWLEVALPVVLVVLVGGTGFKVAGQSVRLSTTQPTTQLSSTRTGTRVQRQSQLERGPGGSNVTYGIIINVSTPRVQGGAGATSTLTVPSSDKPPRYTWMGEKRSDAWQMTQCSGRCAFFCLSDCDAAVLLFVRLWCCFAFACRVCPPHCACRVYLFAHAHARTIPLHDKSLRVCNQVSASHGMYPRFLLNVNAARVCEFGVLCCGGSVVVLPAGVAHVVD